MLPALLAAWVLACNPSAVEETDASGADTEGAPSLVVGLGQGHLFAPLDAGDTLPVWENLDGSLLVAVSARTSGLTPPLSFALRLLESAAGEVLADEPPAPYEATELPAGGHELIAILAPLDEGVEASDVDGVAASLEVDVTDESAAHASWSIELLLDAPPHEG